MIDIVLLLIVTVRTSMLILEDLCQDTFMSTALLIPVKVHSPTMNSIELILNIARSSWRPLPTCRAWVIVTLSNRWPVDLHLIALTCDEVLSLVAARLYH